MTRTEAASALARLRAFVLAADPAGADRAQCLADIAALEGVLANPASLCTRDELFDAVICDEPETGASPLLTDLLDQISTGTLVAYLDERQAEEEALRTAIVHPSDPAEAP